MSSALLRGASHEELVPRLSPNESCVVGLTIFVIIISMRASSAYTGDSTKTLKLSVKAGAETSLHSKDKDINTRDIKMDTDYFTSAFTTTTTTTTTIETVHDENDADDEGGDEEEDEKEDEEQDEEEKECRFRAFSISSCNSRSSTPRLRVKPPVCVERFVCSAAPLNGKGNGKGGKGEILYTSFSSSPPPPPPSSSSSSSSSLEGASKRGNVVSPSKRPSITHPSSFSPFFSGKGSFSFFGSQTQKH